MQTVGEVGLGQHAVSVHIALRVHAHRMAAADGYALGMFLAEFGREPAVQGCFEMAEGPEAA